MSRVLDFMQYDKLTFRDLSLNGDASFNNNVFVSNDLVTNNRLFILGDVSLNNDIYVKETFITDGDASLNADLRVSNDTTLQQRLFVSEDVSLNSDLFIKEMLLVDGDASFNTNLKVSNDATLNDRLFVSGDASFNNNVFVSNDLLTNNDIRCNNRLFVLGDVSWNPNNLPNDCIPSTAIIGGVGSGGSTTTTTTASVVPVININNNSVFDVSATIYVHSFGLPNGGSYSLFNGNYVWTQSGSDLITENNLAAHIENIVKDAVSTSEISLSFYHITSGIIHTGTLTKDTNWNVDFIENSAALVTPIITLNNTSTVNVERGSGDIQYNYEIGKLYGEHPGSPVQFSQDSAMTIPWTMNDVSAYIQTQIQNNNSTNLVNITAYTPWSGSNGPHIFPLFKNTHWTVDYQAFSESSTGSYWTQSTNDLYYTTGNVGIGTTDPSNLLHLYSSGDSSQVRLSNGTSTAGFILEQNTDKHTYISNTESTGDIIFNAGNAVKMRLMSDNIVTIGQGGRIRMLNDGKTSFHPTGNVDPKFQLDVFGLVLAYHSQYGNAGVQVSGRLYKDNGTEDPTPWTGWTTARFQEGIIARNFLAYSDSRIKTNIQEVNDSSALDKLRLLKPSLYNYIDVLARGNNQVYGFLAQEVKEVLPDAVSQYPEFIPNIYSFGTYDDSTNIITIENENYDTASLSMDASNNVYKNVRMYDASDNVIEVCIEEIVGPKEIKIKQDSEVNITSSIFAYGQEVDDFHKLNKDAIFTVTTSALQEVDRQLQAEKAKVATLESQLADVLSRLAALENA